MEGIYLIMAVVGIIIGFFLFFYLIPLGLWLSALLSGVRISLLQLILMRWRKVPPGVIVNALITATKAGLFLSRNELEAHYLAGGNVPSVTNALISAEKAKYRTGFQISHCY